jgi:hypothetical protein
MLGLGIHTQEEYLRMGEGRRMMGARVAYNLLAVGENPSEEQIRLFEDISFSLCTSNGTTRTTFRNRFEDVDAACMEVMKQMFDRDAPLRVEDRAVSHGLTSCEWARRILPLFPSAGIEASDRLVQLVELSADTGEIFITEADGTPLQYIKPPCVVSIWHAESWRNPLRRLVAARARKSFERLALPKEWVYQSAGAHYRTRPIPFIHPEAAALAQKDSRFQFRCRSVFERTPTPCDVVRTMNIFNRSYFSAEQLAEGFRSVFDSLRPGGLWIIGRTLEGVFTNHVTFYERTGKGWKVRDRVGSGSDQEDTVSGLFQ